MVHMILKFLLFIADFILTSSSILHLRRVGDLFYECKNQKDGTMDFKYLYVQNPFSSSPQGFSGDKCQQHLRTCLLSLPPQFFFVLSFQSSILKRKILFHGVVVLYIRLFSLAKLQEHTWERIFFNNFKMQTQKALFISDRTEIYGESKRKKNHGMIIPLSPGYLSA